MDLTTLLVPSILPAVIDGFRGLVNRFTGGAGAKPMNVDEAIKLGQFEIEKLKALAELDKLPNNISLWVANFRASIRYFAIVFILLYVAYVTVADGLPESAIINAQQLAGSVMFFLFGDRVYLTLKNGRGGT